jgi:hypothetical protein
MTLYFNPEWDFLFFDFTAHPDDVVSGMMGLRYDALMTLSMLHDLRAYDPSGVGVRNLTVYESLCRHWLSLAERR